MVERSTKQFVCRYFHDGSWWALNLSAYDWDDAEERATKLGLQLEGEIGEIVPAFVGSGTVVRLLIGVRNFLRPKR